MRDRLIELIQNAVNGCARHWAEIIADHLLANGVIVPIRCKDCTEWDKVEQECSHWYGFRENDYCSYGVLKEREQ